MSSARRNRRSGPRPLPSPRALRLSARMGCLLCDAPAPWLGVWTPDAATLRKLPGPSDQRRRVVYRLCRRHARPGFAAAVEDKVLADAAAMAGDPAFN